MKFLTKAVEFAVFLCYTLTGGRPMTFIGTGFYDPRTGRYLHQYVDHKGRRWIAHSRWALRRTVRMELYERVFSGWNDPYGYNRAMDQAEVIHITNEYRQSAVNSANTVKS